MHLMEGVVGRSSALAALALGVALVGCGIPKEKYAAQVAETELYRQNAEAAGQQASACEERVHKLTIRVGQLEKAKAVISEDAARQRQLAGQLAESKQQLEAERAEAASEAERQRQRALQLEQERTVLEKKSTEYESLTASLSQEIQAGQVQISELKGKVTVRLAERVLFPSGSARIDRSGQATLRKISDAFSNVKDRMIRVEGHTDNVPIHTEQYPSNWELSMARAIAVVRILQAQGVNPRLLGAAGYGEYQPIASNETAEGRAQNRRIEISLAAPLQVVAAP